MREGLFYYVKHYNLDKYADFTIRIMTFISGLWIISASSYNYWLFTLFLIVFLFGLSYVISKSIIEKIFKKELHKIHEGKFLKEKWVFYPLKFYILRFFLLIGMGIIMAFFLQLNKYISIPTCVYVLLIYGIFLFIIIELIPTKLRFYQNGIKIDGTFHPYERVKIIKKGNKKIVEINNIPMYVLFDKYKDVDYVLGLNGLKNILTERGDNHDLHSSN